MAALRKWPAYRRLAASIVIWLKRVLLPPTATDQEWAENEDFRELSDMLQERVRRWPDRWRQGGGQEGRLETLVRMPWKRFGADAAKWAQERLSAMTDP